MLAVDVLGTHEIVAAKDQWNDLWVRSCTTLPTSRAELIDLWAKQFAPGKELRAIVVYEANRWVAALPIVSQRWAKVVNAGSIPRNDWLMAGNLLLDESADVERALELLADVLNKLPWTVYRFSLIPSHESSWQRLRDAMGRAEMQIESRLSHDVSLIATNGDWEAYQRLWSKNHRKNMARTMRRLAEQGGVRVRRHVPTSTSEAASLLDQAFQLEDSGWKGRAGTSIIRTPGMKEFITELASLLIPRKELELAFLELDGRPLAFELLWNAKRTLHSYKVGYDEQFDKLNPGQILMHELLRELFQSRTQSCHAYDCIGPVSPATEKWCGTNYQMSQWTVAPRRRISRAVLFAYQKLRRPGPRPLELCGSEISLVASAMPLTVGDCDSTSHSNSIVDEQTTGTR